LWNQANYLVKNRLAKPDYRDLYNKLKDTSLHLRSLQSRSAQIVLDELSRGWSNFFKFLGNPEKFKKKGIETVRPPGYVNPKTPHRVVTWDKTGFKIEGSRIRLSISKSLKGYLLKKFGFSPEYLWIETGYKDLKKLKPLNIQVVPYKAYGHISFKMVVVYEKEVPEVKPIGNKILAILYVIHLTSYVLRLTSHVSRLTSYVSRLMSYALYLTYKLKEVGIEVRLIDESYTSVTDSCDEGAGVT
ncbi:MAG: hypothetical protein JRI45_07130, partial [Deltaproteobacteria bacterium]|nr:hypothetical protein [Deltaproteobacteria bacterium]